jgi:hypothetical protein
MGAKWQGTGFSCLFGIKWTPEVRGFYVVELADDSAIVRTAFNSDRGVSLFADSGAVGHHSFDFGLGFKGQITDRMYVRVDYDCEAYRHTTTNTVQAALGVSW